MEQAGQKYTSHSHKPGSILNTNALIAIKSNNFILLYDASN